ncbi:glycosyltransferase family 4 protein [Paraburkholderia sp. LEh10]|uniref:glycosyltransferase family 4 protein n=1 Tax=Paraburkholderia sp. LEh10 TaxID=2821353 RepID=UPI001AE85600|nr:glycosyltransferase family 4 protein [Paraburkholderia sp. LEh10]MBP0593890.1 glycosyltransferase family 4 protein [Paraburkholderia sp. LEh10]
MKKPTILALLPFLVKGALSIAVLREMRKRGFDVTVAYCADASTVYTPDPMDDFRSTDRLLDLSNISAHDHRDLVWKEIQQRKVDLILQIGAYSLYSHLPYWKERKPELRIVDTLYNEVGHVVNHFLYERCMDGVIVESEYMQRFVQSCTHKEDPGIAVVRSGIDLDWLTPDVDRKPRDGIVVGYIGRMSSEKNPLGFIDLVEAVHELVPGATFRMSGEGDQAALVRGRVEASPAAGKLIYDGYVEDLPAALRSMDVLVLPSKIDGRPNIVMEANACGVPVIGAPVGGVPELIEDGQNGYLIGPKDTLRIANVLAGWARDSSTLREIQRTSRLTAEQKFSRSRMMDTYAETFIRFAS